MSIRTNYEKWYEGEEYYWGDGGEKPNPYHDSENFDYFVKGN